MSQLKTPLIITHAATPDVTGSVCNKYVFRISVNIAQNIKAASLLAADTGVKKWTTIGPDYAFGHQSWEFFEKYLQELKPDVAFTLEENVVFPPFKTTDLRPLHHKADAIRRRWRVGFTVGRKPHRFCAPGLRNGIFQRKIHGSLHPGRGHGSIVALGDKMPEGLWVGTRYWFLANNSEMNKTFVKTI